jgi:hypothetical protein
MNEAGKLSRRYRNADIESRARVSASTPQTSRSHATDPWDSYHEFEKSCHAEMDRLLDEANKINDKLGSHRLPSITPRRVPALASTAVGDWPVSLRQSALDDLDDETRWNSLRDDCHDYVSAFRERGRLVYDDRLRFNEEEDELDKLKDRRASRYRSTRDDVKIERDARSKELDRLDADMTSRLHWLNYDTSLYNDDIPKDLCAFPEVSYGLVRVISGMASRPTLTSLRKLEESWDQWIENAEEALLEALPENRGESRQDNWQHRRRQRKAEINNTLMDLKLVRSWLRQYTAPDEDSMDMDYQAEPGTEMQLILAPAFRSYTPPPAPEPPSVPESEYPQAAPTEWSQSSVQASIATNADSMSEYGSQQLRGKGKGRAEPESGSEEDVSEEESDADDWTDHRRTSGTATQTTLPLRPIFSSVRLGASRAGK